MPNEDLIYFGDTARVPYGAKSSTTVIRYAREITQFLLDQNVKSIVVACNTVSSHAMEAIKQMTTMPVFGVIDPAVRSLIQRNPQNKKSGLIATKSTIASQSYNNTLNKSGGIALLSKACPLLVPLVEEGYANTPAAEMIIRDYMDPLIAEGIEFLVLGCTHYPLIAPVLKALYPKLTLIDSAEETALDIATALRQLKLLNQRSTSGKISLYVSDMTESVKALKDLFFPNAIEKFEVHQLGD